MRRALRSDSWASGARLSHFARDHCARHVRISIVAALQSRFPGLFPDNLAEQLRDTKDPGTSMGPSVFCTRNLIGKTRGQRVFRSALRCGATFPPLRQRESQCAVASPSI